MFSTVTERTVLKKSLMPVYPRNCAQISAPVVDIPEVDDFQYLYIVQPIQEGPLGTGLYDSTNDSKH